MYKQRHSHEVNGKKILNEKLKHNERKNERKVMIDILLGSHLNACVNIFYFHWSFREFYVKKILVDLIDWFLCMFELLNINK
jgi:hypothetical protein